MGRSVRAGLLRFCLTLVLVSASGARANSFELFGFGPLGMARSGALTADAKAASAAFYNPAMLVLRDSADFEVAFGWNRTSADVRPDANDARLDCTYCEPPDAVGVDLGFVFPLAGKVKNRVALGLALHLPATSFVRVRAADPNRPFWYHQFNNPDRFILFAGAGVRLSEQWALGVGAQMLADLKGQGANVRVDLFSRRVELNELDSGLATRVSPTAGLFFAPLESLRFGLNFRGEMMLFYQVPATIDLDGVGVLAMDIQGINHYQPHTVTLGSAWDVTDQLTFTADLIYGMWSHAPTPYMQLTVDMSGETLEAIGLDEALDLSSNVPPPGFKDTLGVKASVAFDFTDRFAVLGGFSFRPTPVPKQNVPGTNILDSNTVGASVGLSFAGDDPLEIFAAPVHIDLAAHAAFILPRKATREATDPVPSYSYSARTLGVSSALRFDF